jgi:hypothetical protein
VARSGLIQASAPSLRSSEMIAWLSGTQTASTKMTAAPRPMAVSTFFETARKEHMPRKNARAMFSTKIAFTARFR